MFIEILKDSLRLMKKNLNLTQLVFILFIIVTLFLPVIASVKINIKIIPMIIIFFIFLCSFMAGLFFAFKKSIDYETEPPKTDNPFDLSPMYFAEFFQGAGKYTTKFILAGLLVTVLLLLFSYGYSYIVHHYFTIPQKLYGLMNTDLYTSEAKMMGYISTFNLTEQEQMGKLSLFTLVSICLYGYLTMLYPAILVSKEDNFFKSFFISLKYLFANIPISLLLFLFFNISLTIMNMLSIVTANNIFISVLVILFQCYLNVWYILSLFVYYEKVK